MQLAAHGVTIEVDDQGPLDGPPLLLLMGLGMQLTAWPAGMVALLVARGLRVIRIDNRDAGLSQRFDAEGTPNLAGAALRYFLHLRVPTAYTLADMAEDAWAVLDALGIARAQVCGASMGGMIAQHMAARQPGRVARLNLLMTSSGARSLPQPSLKVRAALLERRPAGGLDVDAEVARLTRLFTLIGSPAFRPDPVEFKSRLTASVLRAWHPSGVARQLIAVAADGDRSSLLAHIIAPTHIVHGDADPLVPVAAAHDLRAKIAGATLEVIEGMGHDLPAALWPRLAAAIAGPGSAPG